MKRQVLLMMGTAALTLGMMTAAHAQTATPTPSPSPNAEGAHRGQALRNFDEFLDQHPEMREDLRRNPRMANNSEYLENHPELREFEKNHPGVDKQLDKHPGQFIKHEARYQRWENRHGGDKDFRPDRDHRDRDHRDRDRRDRDDRPHRQHR